MVIDNQETTFFRAEIINKLAKKEPAFCDGSGKGFWPIPIMIPVVLSKCLFLIHQEWYQKIVEKDDTSAKALNSIRIKLTKLVSEGDLGEDHAGVYLQNHPTVLETDIEKAPFYEAYTKIIQNNDPIILLGFIYCIETGSLEAIKALLSNNIIVNQGFAKLHLIEEIEHEKIAGEIKETILDSIYAQRFLEGCKLHNDLYNQVIQN